MINLLQPVPNGFYQIIVFWTWVRCPSSNQGRYRSRYWSTKVWPTWTTPGKIVWAVVGPPLAYRAERASWTTAEFFRLPRQLGQETWNDVFFLEIMGWFTYSLKVIYLGDEMHPKFQLFAISLERKEHLVVCWLRYCLSRKCLAVPEKFAHSGDAYCATFEWLRHLRHLQQSAKEKDVLLGTSVYCTCIAGVK